MRHRKKKLQFNCPSDVRDANFRNMLTSLFIYKRIKISKVKAKFLRWLVDSLISKSMGLEDFNAIRELNEKLYNKESKLEAMDLIKKYKEAKKHSGFTRMVGAGFRRGDNSEMVILELITDIQND